MVDVDGEERDGEEERVVDEEEDEEEEEEEDEEEEDEEEEALEGPSNSSRETSGMAERSSEFSRMGVLNTDMPSIRSCDALKESVWRDLLM